MNTPGDCSEDALVPVPETHEELGDLAALTTPIAAEIAWQTFDPRWVSMRRLVNFGYNLGNLPLAIVAWIFFIVPFKLEPSVQIGIACLLGILLVVSGIVGHLAPQLTFRQMRFRLSPLGLEYQRGVFWKHRLAIPLSRIQHADVAQGPLERRFGVGKLIVYTAGTSHSAVELRGLTIGIASRLRDAILMGRETTDGV